MEKIDAAEAEREIELLRRNRSVKRRLKNGAYLDLESYATEILLWARQPRVSKSLVKEMLHVKFGLEVSGDRIYRFVVARLGAWPNQRTQKEQ